MFFKKYLFAGLMILTASILAAAQQPNTRAPRNPDPNRQDAATRRWYEELQRRENVQTGIGSISEKTESLVLKRQENALKKLKPLDEERAAFEEFLKQSNTGLIKFAAETNCAAILDITNPDVDCLNYYIPGKGRAYSFRKDRYTHEAFADLERLNGAFVAPGTYILGLMASLGDMPIETIDLENKNVSALLKFTPADEIEDIVRQEKEITKGKQLGELVYTKAVPIEESKTYLLRSVAYRAKFVNMPKTERKKGSLDDDDRSDVVIAFRVVRKYTDNTLLLLWKEIFRRYSPKIEVDLSK